MTAKKSEKKAALPPKMTTSGDILLRLALIAADPNASDTRIEQLITLRAEIEAEHAGKAWVRSMNDCQTQMTTISKDAANDQTHSKYATYQALDNVMRPIYTGAGFSVTFTTCPDECLTDIVRVQMALVHNAGAQREYLVEMPCDGKGAKGNQVMTRTHATGSALTYARRYLLCLAFNISTGDDDGNAAGRMKGARSTAVTSTAAEYESTPGGDTIELISQDQADMLEEMSGLVGADMPAYLKYLTKLWDMTIQGMADIPANRYTEAYEMLYEKGKKSGTITD